MCQAGWPGSRASRAGGPDGNGEEAELRSVKPARRPRASVCRPRTALPLPKAARIIRLRDLPRDAKGAPDFSAIPVSDPLTFATAEVWRAFLERGGHHHA